MYNQPAYNIIEWKGSCKFLFAQLLFKSDTISRPIFRGNDISRNCGAHREIPSFAPELFFLPTLIEVTAVFFLEKQRALGRAWKKYDIFAGTAWTDNSEDLMIHALIGNAAISGC